MIHRQKKSGPTDSDQRVRAKRIHVQGMVMVESRTIGAPMVFSMPTENVSRTGLLLVGSQGYKIPFQVNTLLELAIDTTGSLWKTPLSCLGKIVRIVERDQKREFFGVQIVHMEPKEQQAWEKTLEELESLAPSEATESEGTHQNPLLPA